jgi:hypothetical protein
LQPIAGTVTVNDNILTGTGTTFSTDLDVGDNIYLGTEGRVIVSITSDTTLTVNDSYTGG